MNFLIYFFSGVIFTLVIQLFGIILSGNGNIIQKIIDFLKVNNEVAISVLTAVFITIFVLFFVLRMLERIQRTNVENTYQITINEFINLKTIILRDQKLFEIYYKGLEDYENLVSNEKDIKKEKEIFEGMMLSFFKLFENLYYQQEIGLLDHSLWEGWNEFIHYEFCKKVVKDWWDDRGKSHNFFQGKFKEYINKCVFIGRENAETT